MKTIFINQVYGLLDGMNKTIGDLIEGRADFKWKP